MYNFEKLTEELIQEFSHFKTLESISSANQSQIIAKIYTPHFKIWLEILNKEEIKIIFPYGEKDKILFSTYFNYPFEIITPIYANKRSALTKLLIKDFINPPFEKVVKHILFYFLTFSQNNPSFLQLLQLEHQKMMAKNRLWEEISETFKGRFLNLKETMLKIQQEKLSIARFGDGEIKCMLTKEGCVFQHHDWQLMRELREISQTPLAGLLVCYPSLMTEEPWWHDFWLKYWAGCKYYLPAQIGDAMISRPEAFRFYAQEMVTLWKSLWENKRVCIITGQNSRFNAEHFLFDNAQSKMQILSANKNAYAEVNQIMHVATQVEADIFLIALGPAGTVLASRLHQAGKWALDIGHLNNSYDTVFLGMDNPEGIN